MTCNLKRSASQPRVKCNIIGGMLADDEYLSSAVSASTQPAPVATEEDMMSIRAYSRLLDTVRCYYGCLCYYGL